MTKKYRIIKAKSFSGDDIYVPQEKKHIFFIPYWKGLVQNLDGFDCGFPTLKEAEKRIKEDMGGGGYEVIKEY